MTSGAQTPTLKVTKETSKSSLDDVTERDRSPVEDAFYESFLLQSRSDVESLYASNIYWSQKHAKEVKDLNRQKFVCMSSMTKDQREMIKKMNKLQQKQEQIFEEKRKKLLTARTGQNGRRIRPQSTSAMPNDLRRGDPRFRSGSVPFLDPLELSLGSKHLSKSSENLFEGSPNRLGVNTPNKLLSKSCEDLSGLHDKPNKVVLPSIERSPSCEAIDNAPEDDDDSTFITKVQVAPQPSPPTRPKKASHLLKPVGFDPHRRRGSLPNPAELERQLNLERRRGSVEIGEFSEKESTSAKWVPKGRSLPPI